MHSHCSVLHAIKRKIIPGKSIILQYSYIITMVCQSYQLPSVPPLQSGPTFQNAPRTNSSESDNWVLTITRSNMLRSKVTVLPRRDTPAWGTANSKDRLEYGFSVLGRGLTVGSTSNGFAPIPVSKASTAIPYDNLSAFLSHRR
jgi:hypothetical protein